jgi:Dockerin type I domain
MGTWSRQQQRLVCEHLERRDAPTVVPVGPEFRVNAVVNVTASVPAVAVADNGNYIVTWEADGVDGSGYAVLARRYSNAGVALSSDIQVNTYTTGSQQNPAVAADSAGNFVIVWGSASVQDGSREGVYMRRYNSSGNPLSGEIQVNQFTLDIQGNPSVAMDGNGDFVVAWESNYQDGDGYAIYARKYSSAGVPITNEFQVNQSTLGDQQNATVAIDTAGDFVVAWQGPDPNGYGVYARRYGSSGLPLGGEFRVNQETIDDQTKPVVAMDAAGDFGVAWQSRAQDGGTTGVYARQYNSAGVAQAGEFRVNSYVTGVQDSPSVASNAAGDLTVTWRSVGQDGDSGGVFGQRVSSSGQFLGSEFQINSTTAGNQTDPAVASNAAGDSTAVWSAASSPVSGIIGQRFAPPPAPQATLMVDDGSGQRSGIRYLTLNFNTTVNVAPGGIVLTGPAGNVSLTIDYSISTAMQTVAKLTFSGTGVTAAGLVDGHYTLTLSSSLITNSDGVGYDGDGDGLAGPSGTFMFHRWFGDVNGDGDTDAADFVTFREQFGTDSTQSGFKYWLDYDGDGTISVYDFIGFRKYFMTNI